MSRLFDPPLSSLAAWNYFSVFVPMAFWPRGREGQFSAVEKLLESFFFVRQKLSSKDTKFGVKTFCFENAKAKLKFSTLSLIY